MKIKESCFATEREREKRERKKRLVKEIERERACVSGGVCQSAEERHNSENPKKRCSFLFVVIWRPEGYELYQRLPEELHEEVDQEIHRDLEK
ncbi:unnamed protein product [Microthlaspi erraticum]|uniref:Uncharacterized protein n=1 Tax=Microthlaspi erraticum TaxID=1685480 RepID=A0A6D2I1A1_9BRAS|nr:unnamed protein product [Microthlaspi erraticum]